MSRYFVLINLALLLLALPARAQEKAPYAFGKVTPEDFKPAYAIDSGAAAVVVAESGKWQYDGTTGDLELTAQFYRRVHILKKPGYDAADFTIYLNTADEVHPDVLHHLKAATYNLEDGKVVATKLDSRSVYTNKENKEDHYIRFTMPAVKEGSIIEVSYDCDYYSLLSPAAWNFQGIYPTLWSQFIISVPSWSTFAVLPGGFYKPDYQKRSHNETMLWKAAPESGAGYGAQERRGSVSTTVTDHIYTTHNLPGMQEESYMTSFRNYATGIAFQLSSVNYTGNPKDEKTVIPTWPELQVELMNKAAHFGATFSGPAFYLQDALKTIIAGKQTNLEKTKAIYYWLQQNMARDKDNSLFAATSLKKAFDSRRGNSSAINLLLMAMLKEAGIAAWPIILSTRDHGFIYEQYPLITRFNYTVAQVKLYEGEFVLDASEPLLGFGKLPLRCYNGAARLMTPDAPPVYFYADSLQEGDLTSVRLQMDNAGNLSGSVDEIQGYHHSLESRQQIKASGVVALEKSLATSLGDDPVVQHLQLHNADSLEAPLGISFDFTLPENKTQDLIYLSPMLGQSFAANPFTAAERLYPVEMPVARQDSYTLNFTLPDNYAVEELPQSASFKLPDGSAGFRYIIQQEGHNVQLRVVLRFKKATFKPEEYGGLRAFFDDVVKKEAEQIVLKRK